MWEYLTILLPTAPASNDPSAVNEYLADLEGTLDAQGSEGWELCHVGPSGRFAIFKRKTK